MNAKTTIKKILFIAVWLGIGGGMLTLLLAAISKKNQGLCEDYSITINGARNNLFIDKQEIKDLLVKATKGNIKDQPIASFQLHELEQMLEHNNWIDEAELYFDNQNVLHITVTEKEPVARLFTTSGNSFYIDGLGRKMPLSDKLSARVPVFTGFPERKKLTSKDSLLLDQVRVTANYIIDHPFWMSQVSQIDITPERKFEMIPVVGNHMVKLGNGEEIDKKFYRLMVFYKEVLSKTGFDRYKMIDVQYKGQVVVSKYAGQAKIDSVQLRRNVEKLLRQSIEAENDTASRIIAPIIKLEADSINMPDPELQDVKEINPEKNSNPNPRLSVAAPTVSARDGGGQAVKSSQPKAVETKKGKLKNVNDNRPKPAEKKSEPKAVMPRKPVEDPNGGYN